MTFGTTLVVATAKYLTQMAVSPRRGGFMEFTAVTIVLHPPAGVVMQLGLISFCQDSGRYSGVDNVVVICYVFGEYTALAGQTTTENPISQNSIRTHKTQQHIRPMCFNLEYIDYRS